MIFFVNDNFFSKYLKIDMTSLGLHSGYPLKETKWRLVQEIDQEIDTALGSLRGRRKKGRGRGEGKREKGREPPLPNPSPLFPVLPIPYPIPLSTPATQASVGLVYLQKYILG